MGLGLPELLVVVIVFAGLFYALRSFFLWYYKINERLNIQKQQLEVLEKILQKLTDGSSPTKAH